LEDILESEIPLRRKLVTVERTWFELAFALLPEGVTATHGGRREEQLKFLDHNHRPSKTFLSISLLDPFWPILVNSLKLTSREKRTYSSSILVFSGSQHLLGAPHLPQQRLLPLPAHTHLNSHHHWHPPSFLGLSLLIL
jgi:hypothetical protein